MRNIVKKEKNERENQKGEFSIHEKPFFQDTKNKTLKNKCIKSVQQKKQTAPSFFLLKKEKQKKIVLQKCARIQIRIGKKIKDWEKRQSKTKKNFKRAKQRWKKRENTDKTKKENKWGRMNKGRIEEVKKTFQKGKCWKDFLRWKKWRVFFFQKKKKFKMSKSEHKNFNDRSLF